LGLIKLQGLEMAKTVQIVVRPVLSGDGPMVHIFLLETVESYVACLFKGRANGRGWIYVLTKTNMEIQNVSKGLGFGIISCGVM